MRIHPIHRLECIYIFQPSAFLPPPGRGRYPCWSPGAESVKLTQKEFKWHRWDTIHNVHTAHVLYIVHIVHIVHAIHMYVHTQVLVIRY